MNTLLEKMPVLCLTRCGERIQRAHAHTERRISQNLNQKP